MARKSNPAGRHIDCGDLPPKQCRQLQHVYESARSRGFNKKRAAQQAWSTVNRTLEGNPKRRNPTYTVTVDADSAKDFDNLDDVFRYLKDKFYISDAGERIYRAVLQESGVAYPHYGFHGAEIVQHGDREGNPMKTTNPSKTLTSMEWDFLSAIDKISARGDGWPEEFILPKTRTKLKSLGYIKTDGRMIYTTKKGSEALASHRQKNPGRHQVSAPYVVYQHSTNGRWFVAREGYGSAVTSPRGYSSPAEAYKSAADRIYTGGEERDATIVFEDDNAKMDAMHTEDVDDREFNPAAVDRATILAARLARGL